MHKQNTILLSLREKGISQQDLVRMTGYCAATVNYVIFRKANTLVIQDCIAALLQMDPVDLWGMDYHPRARHLRKTSGARYDLLKKRYVGFNQLPLGDRIRSARYDKRYPLEQLADITGIDVSTLSRYESGARRPSRPTCERLAVALDVDAEYLLFGKIKPYVAQPPRNMTAENRARPTSI